MRCDTLIVGGGVTGLAIALALSEKQKVVVLEAARIAEGSTGWCAGILSTSTTLDLDQVEAQLGQESARTIAFFLSDAISKMKNTVPLLKSDDWQSGSSLYTAARKSHRALLHNELAVRHRFGLQTNLIDQGHHWKFWRGFPAALELSGEHAVHPVKLVLELAAAIKRAGSFVFEETPVSSWKHEGQRFSVKAGSYTVSCDNLILCPGLGSKQFPEVRRLNTACIPVTSHILVTEPCEEFAAYHKKGHCIALWDSFQLYHYLRYFPDGRVLVGGEESVGINRGEILDAADPHIKRLHEWAASHHARRLPPVQFAWKAGLALPGDGLPLTSVGKIQDNLLIAAITDGLPFSFLLGTVISAIIERGEHPLSRLLDHNRQMPADARLLAMLPAIEPLRKAAYEIAFAGLRLRDMLF